MAIRIKKAEIGPLSPVTTFPSLINFLFESTTASTPLKSLTFSATQNTAISIKWWSPGTATTATPTKQYSYLAQPIQSALGNVYLDGLELTIRNPVDSFLLSMPGNYSVTLPGNLFSNQTFASGGNVTQIINQPGAIASSENRLAENKSNVDFFTIIGSDQSDTLRGGTKADFIEGGKGNDTITGGGRAPTYALQNGKIVSLDTTELARDIVFYNSDKSNFTITKTTTGFQVQDNKTGLGTDSLQNVDFLVFKQNSLRPLREEDNEFRYLEGVSLRLDVGIEEGTDAYHPYWIDGSYFDDVIDATELAKSINPGRPSDSQSVAQAFIDAGTWIGAGEGNDRVFAGKGRDHIRGDLGNDYLDGGENADSLNHWEREDQANYEKTRENFKIEKKTDGSFVVTDTSSDKITNEGVDTLINIESLWFQDGEDSGTNVRLVVGDSIWINTNNGFAGPSASLNFDGSIFDDLIRISTYTSGSKKLFGSASELKTLGSAQLDSQGNLISPDQSIWVLAPNAEQFTNAPKRYYVNPSLITNVWGNLGDGNDRIIFDNDKVGGGVTLGTGNDVLIGHATTNIPELNGNNYWQTQVNANYEGSFKRYQISTGQDDSRGTLTGVANAQYIKIIDNLSSSLGGSGTDYLVNVDAISFSDRYINVSFSYWQSNSWYWDQTTEQSVNVLSGVSTSGSAFNDTIGPNSQASGAVRKFFLGDDNLSGGDGDDEIYGGSGTDTLRGGRGNDRLDGGDEVRSEATKNLNWSSGGFGLADVAEYAGPKSRYVITINSDSTVTVRDTKAGADGTDTLKNIEVIRFADDEKIFLRPVSQKETWWYSQTSGNSPTSATGTQWRVTGSIGDDEIEGNPGSLDAEAGFIRDWIDGAEGNDIIRAGSGSDYISGGVGNDLIDGGADGDLGLSTWDRGDVAVYDAPSSRFVITRDGQDFIVRDKLSDALGGLGIDRLQNIERIQFSNITLETIPNRWSHIYSDGEGIQRTNVNIYGTNFGDRIDESNTTVDYLSITSGNGDDLIVASDKDDYISLRAGFDIVDGGSGEDRIYIEAPRSRFDIQKIQYNDLLITDSEQFAVKTQIDNTYAADARPSDIFVVRDLLSKSYGGLGVKYVYNLEMLQFLYVDGSQSNYVNLTVRDNQPYFGTDFEDQFSIGSELGSGNWLYGNGGDDYFSVADGSGRYLTITGGQGNDRINVDSDDIVTARYEGSYHRYTIEKISDDSFVVRDSLAENLGGEGEDTLVGVSKISFYQKQGDYLGDQAFDLAYFGTPEWTAFEPEASPVEDEIFYAQYEGQTISLWNYPALRFQINSIVEDGVQKLVVKDLLPSSSLDSLGTDTYVGYSYISFSSGIGFNLKINQYSWYDDWNKVGQLSYSGTFFDDVIEFKTGDYNPYNSDVLPQDGSYSLNMSGGAGNDVLFAGAGGSWITGGFGNDVVDGGTNGTSSNSWQNSDKYNTSIDSNFAKVYSVTLSGTQASLEMTIDGVVYTNASWPSLGLLPAEVRDVVGRGFSYLESIGAQRAFDFAGNLQTDYTSAVIVQDLNPAANGGQGADLLFGIEEINFTNGGYQFSPRYNLDDWNALDKISIDQIWGQGTTRDDRMTVEDAADYNDKTVQDLIGVRVQFNGQEGHDVLIGGSAGDHFNPGSGNDVIDGRSNSGFDRWNNPNRDHVQFDGKFERFDLIEAKFEYKSGQWVYVQSDRSGFAFKKNGLAWEATDSTKKLQDEQLDDLGDVLGRLLVNVNTATQSSLIVNFVSDRLPTELSGMGTDALINVENISFSNKWMPLVVDPWYARDAENKIYHAGVSGTKSGETLGRTVDRSGYDWSGDDWLDGGEGNDILYGGAGGDNLRGGEGDDILYGEGNGVVDSYGQLRTDTAQFSGAFDSYQITQLSSNKIEVKDISQGGVDGTDTLYDIENLSFSDQWISIKTNQWINRDQNNKITNIHYSGSIFSDTINHAASEYAHLRADFNANAGDDILLGGGASDYFNGGMGDDMIVGGGVGYESWGQLGFDTVRYDGVFKRYEITTLTNGESYTVNGKVYLASEDKPILLVEDTVSQDLGGYGLDVLIDIQRLDFTDRSYTVRSTSSALDLNGDGRPDNAIIIGTDSSDNLVGSDLVDRIDGGSGNDQIFGNAGDDYLIGGSGNDAIDGGEGYDTAEYRGNRSSYSIALNGNTFTVSGSMDGTDTLSAVEVVKFSDRSYVLVAPDDLSVDVDKDSTEDYVMRWGTDILDDDLVVSEDKKFWLEGLDGDDNLIGGNADDVLVGGLGNDYIDGGLGNNIALINAVTTLDYDVELINDQYHYIFNTNDGQDRLVNVQKVIFTDGELLLDSVNAITSVVVDKDNNGILDTEIVTGSWGDDILYFDSSVFDLEVISGYGNDEVFGGRGSDLFIDGVGNDDYDGGYTDLTLPKLGKKDTVWFDGTYLPGDEDSDYEINQLSHDSFQILNLKANEINTVYNIESLQFLNTSVEIGVSHISRAVWGKSGISREYIFTGSDYDDLFISTLGNDIFTGLSGRDRYVFKDDIGFDRITDFQAGPNGDVIEVDINQFADFAAVSRQLSAVDGGSQFNLGSGHSVLLSLVGVSDLTEDNFIFTY